jgi:hypothetical protein
MPKAKKKQISILDRFEIVQCQDVFLIKEKGREIYLTGLKYPLSFPTKDWAEEYCNDFPDVALPFQKEIKLSQHTDIKNSTDEW